MRLMEPADSLVAYNMALRACIEPALHLADLLGLGGAARLAFLVQRKKVFANLPTSGQWILTHKI